MQSTYSRTRFMLEQSKPSSCKFEQATNRTPFKIAAHETKQRFCTSTKHTVIFMWQISACVYTTTKITQLTICWFGCKVRWGLQMHRHLIFVVCKLGKGCYSERIYLRREACHFVTGPVGHRPIWSQAQAVHIQTHTNSCTGALLLSWPVTKWTCDEVCLWPTEPVTNWAVLPEKCFLNGWIKKRSHTQKSHPKRWTPDI